jgi:site-specific DNA-methyltransferase (adenine-specific)
MSIGAINQKIWSMATYLMGDGISNSDYLEQLTYLLFLKMADEYGKNPNKRIEIPDDCKWETLTSRSGDDLFKQYRYILDTLAQQKGTLQQIYAGAQNKISTPAMLAKVIEMVDKENWSELSTDVKGDIYEGLLAKIAEDTRTGAGQYFTPRALIKTIVKCVQPKAGKTIADPCCGSGGFLLAAKDFIEQNEGKNLDRDQKEFLKFKTFRGWEIVPSTYRLCLMNLFLHNISDFNGVPPIVRNDALLSDPKERFDYVLTNPPFGRKSALTFTNEEGKVEKEELTYKRQDFFTTTSNKQLNFVQHIHTLLKVGGTAAVVLPDNVLFEGGAGEIIRKKLLLTTDLHTILRLPTGIFYANGVKANVLFFQNKEASPNYHTKEIWFYDYRTNVTHTLKRDPLKEEDLADFVKCYNPENRFQRTETYHPETNPNGRWRKFTVEELLARDKTSLDISWIREEDEDANRPLTELMAELRERSERIAKAVGALQGLLTNINEATE